MLSDNLTATVHVFTGELYTLASYLQDGSLIVEHPFKQAVSLETSPHPLLNTEHQLQLKRKIVVSDDVTHRLEWRYAPRYQRGDGARTLTGLKRRMRVGPTDSRHAPVHDTPQPLADVSATDAAAAGLGYAGKSLAVCAPYIVVTTTNI